MVLIALAIVFAGLGAMSLSSADSGSDNAEGAGTTSASAAPTTPRATTTAAAPTSAAVGAPSAGATTTPGASTTPPAGEVDRATPVRVLNNSLVAGLAATTADELVALGWTNTSTGNYAANTLAATTVYYGSAPADEAAAAAVAADLGATTAPMPPGLGEDSGVVVVVTGR